MAIQAVSRQMKPQFPPIVYRSSIIDSNRHRRKAAVDVNGFSCDEASGRF